MPTGTDTVNATAIETMAPMVAPTSGMRSVRATKMASAAAYGTPVTPKNASDAIPATTDVATLPRT